MNKLSEKKKEKLVQVSVKIPQDIYNTIKVLATKKHIKIADVLRGFIQKGIKIDGYKDDIELITNIVRQEVKSQMTPQVERIVKILVKIGKISAGLYYTTIKTLIRMVGSTKSQTFKELATESRKLGIKYMKYKDSELDKYLEDDEMIFADIDKL